MDPDKQTDGVLTRRDFVRRTAGATLAAAMFPTIIPGSALGKNGAVAPSNRLSLGVIGCGPQGLGDMSNFLNQKDCRVVAACDVKTDQLEKAKNQVNSCYENKDCLTFKDFREVVTRPDIDAFLLATPDHWHVLVALAAVNAGKDIYLEKPIGPSLEEAYALRSALDRKKRVFQFGTQQRSGRLFRMASAMARNGAIGSLKHINVWAPGSAPGGSLKQVPPPPGLDYDFWVGPARFTPHTEDRCTDEGIRKTWWFTSDFALGFIAGWGIHPVDIAIWGGGDSLGGTVTAEGRGSFRCAEGVCDTATIWDVDFTFGSGVTMKFVGVPNAGNQGHSTGEPFLHQQEWQQRYHRITEHGTAFEGASGWVKVDREGINLQPESLIDLDENSFKTQLVRSPDHARNFLDCIKNRAKTVCPIEAAIASETICHIADISIRLGRKVTFDLKKEQFVKDAEANMRMKARPMRKPWHL